MRDPEKEVEHLKANPVSTETGGIFINTKFEGRPSVELDLSPFPGRTRGSLFLFSPEEWVRVVAVIEEYFQSK